MNQATERAENRNDVVSEALAAAKKADEMRGAAVKELLAQRAQIDEDLKTLGYKAADNATGFAAGIAHGNGHGAFRKGVTTKPDAKRFKNLALAQIARILLTEAADGLLHGSQIEKLAKDGGFKGGSKNFQNYLPVALKRAGGFENIGGNRWKLNPGVAPQRG